MSEEAIKLRSGAALAKKGAAELINAGEIERVNNAHLLSPKALFRLLKQVGCHTPAFHLLRALQDLPSAVNR